MHHRRMIIPDLNLSVYMHVLLYEIKIYPYHLKKPIASSEEILSYRACWEDSRLRKM